MDEDFSGYFDFIKKRKNIYYIVKYDLECKPVICDRYHNNPVIYNFEVLGVYKYFSHFQCKIYLYLRDSEKLACTLRDISYNYNDIIDFDGITSMDPEIQKFLENFCISGTIDFF